MSLIKKRREDEALFKIYSFYNSKVNPKVPQYQQAVFNHFGFKIHHFIDENFTHGDFLNHICKSVTDTRFLVFFDIDCIPLNKEWIDKTLADLSEPGTIVGAAQTANHLRDAKNLYVSPFFFAISTAYLKELNYPDMNMTEDMDAGQNLTEQIIKKGGNIRYWWPTAIEEEKWYLHHPEHTVFGLGTTYNNTIYHAFLSLHNLSARFIKKCKSVLPWYYLKLQLSRFKG
jgi:hypothetical protein